MPGWAFNTAEITTSSTYKWTAVLFNPPGHHLTYVPDEHGIFWCLDDSRYPQGLSWDALMQKCVKDCMQPTMIIMERCTASHAERKAKMASPSTAHPLLAVPVMATQLAGPRARYKPPSMGIIQRVRTCRSITCCLSYDVTYLP